MVILLGMTFTQLVFFETLAEYICRAKARKEVEPMKILCAGTYGSDDPTRAGFPFIFAKGAVETAHEPTVFLAGEATYLLKEEVAATQGVGWPRQADLWNDVVQAKVPVYV